MDFCSQIKNTEGIVKENLHTLRKELFKKWGQYLFVNNIEHEEQLTTYQVAFLKLLDECMASQILPQIHPLIKKVFEDFYEEEQNDIKIILNAIRMPEENLSEWELMFEDETIDPIVHAYMDGWKLNYTALTS
jgi:hypothetical protein